MSTDARRVSSGLAGAALTGVLLLSLPAFGKPTSAQIAAIRASCQSDYRANCAGVPPGGSAALACLQKNLANLSPGCQQAVSATTRAAAPAAAAPSPTQQSPTAEPYATTTPQSTPPAPAAASTPTPASPPSAAPTPAPTPAPKPTAKAAPPEFYPPMSLREEVMLIRQACGPDYRALCAGERPGEGRIATCLRTNAASLSGPCKAALTAVQR